MELYPLLSGEAIEFRAFAVHPQEDEPERLQSFLPSWDALYEAADAYSEDYNCYFGVAPRVRDSRGEWHGGTANVARIPAVWLDLDAKEGFTREDRLAQLEKYPPTYLTDSGNGFHCFYVLDRDMDPQDAQRLMKEMAAFFRADNVGDPPHILRIPNTQNFKDPENPKVVSILWARPEDVWNPEALPRTALPLAESNGSRPREKRMKLIEEHGIAQGGSTIEGEWFEGRNKAMFDVAVYYMQQLWDRGDVLDHLQVINKLNQPPLSEHLLTDMVNRVFTYDAPVNITEIEEATKPVSSSLVIPRQSFDMISIHDLPEPTKPKYLWKPYFLLNRLVLLDGEEGIGKGLLLCYLASQHSDEHPFAWFTAEDDPIDDVNPRVRAVRTFFGLSAKAELNIYFNQGRDPRFNADNEALFDVLEHTIDTYGTKVLVLDPGRSFIGPREGQRDFSYNAEADVRPTMQRLMRISRDREVAIIFVHHFNKNSQAPLRHRTTGTGAWRQVVRQQVTMLWDDKMDDGVFGVQKSNIGPTGSVRAYRKEVVDDWAVFNPAKDLDLTPNLQQWADDRTKVNKSSITVIDPEVVVEQVRDWAAEALDPGDPFPARSEIMKSVGLNQASATEAMKALRDENWVTRPKGQRGGGYIWQPPDWWLNEQDGGETP